MGSHNSMLVTKISDMEMLLQVKVLMSMKMKTLVDNEEPRSTYPSSLELQEVDQIKKKEEEEVLEKEPVFIEGSLRMDHNNIQDSLNTLHGTHALVSKICWSMEEKYSMEDIEKIEKAISNIKGNI